MSDHAVYAFRDVLCDTGQEQDHPAYELPGVCIRSGTVQGQGEPDNPFRLCRGPQVFREVLLKTIEESFKGTSLIRCNRKYIVNVDKIKVLRKEDDGYVIDLDNEEVPPIAVTKTYVQNVLSRFSPQPGAQDEGKGPSA